MGGEFRTKGVNVLLGPVVAPLGRVAEGGRNWEGEFACNMSGLLTLIRSQVSAMILIFVVLWLG